jgi:hypothetical protein
MPKTRSAAKKSSASQPAAPVKRPVWLSDVTLHAAIKARAAHLGVTVSALVEDILREHLAVAGPNRRHDDVRHVAVRQNAPSQAVDVCRRSGCHHSKAAHNRLDQHACGQAGCACARYLG